jgi:hypothetical protein
MARVGISQVLAWYYPAMEETSAHPWLHEHRWYIAAAVFVAVVILTLNFTSLGAVTYTNEAPDESLAVVATTSATQPEVVTEPVWPLTLDQKEYDARLLDLVRYQPPATTSTSSSPLKYEEGTNVTVRGEAWPPAAPYPHGGAILPFSRIIAYYGNFYSTRMGILGEFASSTVLAQLASTSAAWEAADPDTPVVPAIHYIAMVAQAEAGSDGMYRNVMPDREIQKAYDMAKTIDGIMFIDLQVGLSTIERELPQFRDWLARPEVHLGIDPEFSMKAGNPPGTVIGTYDAADINYVIEFLSDIVREEKLSPKVLVIHRFTQNMVTNYQDIKPTPEVQVVMHMDGWGPRDLKRSTYSRVIIPEPVQFAGLKIFYKNDMKPPSTGIFSPEEALELNPKPVYIQYQ